MFLRIGSVLVGETCKILNSNQISCFIISNADGSIKLDFSYNQIDWYSTNTNFTFLPCEAGYGTSSYAEPCKPCPLGTFKNSKGISTCAECPLNTFSDSLASVNCTSCPNKMKSPGKKTGLTSISQCVCVNNTMVHPSLGICLDCPVGAICEGENVTLPLSQNGWWFSKENILIFYQCFPHSRCINGGSPDNCTIGYEGLRCGRCIEGYFRSKLTCKRCNDKEITALTLVIAIIVILLVLVVACIIFIITSTTISQLTSYSITFGYWQILSTFTNLDINWPSFVDGTLSAAEASNFNVIPHFNSHLV
jgi:hypothetical protein